MEKIVFVGYGGHAKSIAETIERCEMYEIVGYTDFQECVSGCRYRYLGTDEELSAIYRNGCRSAVVAIGQIGPDVIRHKLYGGLKEIGFRLPVIIDDSALVAPDAAIGEGSFIGKMVVVNAGASIGKMGIINTGSIIEHDDMIGEFCHIAVGATLCGKVTIGDNSFVGASATVIHDVVIGKECTIGAGSLVRHPVEDKRTVYGLF